MDNINIFYSPIMLMAIHYLSPVVCWFHTLIPIIDMLQWLFNILIHFEQASLSHGNICIQNIAVDVNGNWLFIGLEHMCKISQVCVITHYYIIYIYYYIIYIVYCMIFYIDLYIYINIYKYRWKTIQYIIWNLYQFQISQWVGKDVC